MTSDNTILVPLTNSLYIPGKLCDVENVIVDVGTGYYVQKVRSCAVACSNADLTFYLLISTTLRVAQMRKSTTKEK